MSWFTARDPPRIKSGAGFFRKMLPLVHAHRVELVASRQGNGCVAAIRDYDRRAVGGVQREQRRAGLELRRLREQALHVLQADRLDVGNLAAAEARKGFRRDGGQLVLFVGHWPSTPFWSSPVLRQSCCLMAIVFTTRSGSGRARSIDSSPFLRSAPSTSMPSASTKVRWNCRAAMPRCRYCRALSSCWRPRMTSWLSSMLTSSWSRVKPATASVMRNRSGWPLARSHLSIL